MFSSPSDGEAPEQAMTMLTPIALRRLILKEEKPFAMRGTMSGG
jgi:hypothetical protein